MPRIDPSAAGARAAKPTPKRVRRPKPPPKVEVHVHVHAPAVRPNPDQRETRSPKRKAHDQKIVRRNIRQAKSDIRQRQIPTGDKPSTRAGDFQRAETYVKGQYARAPKGMEVRVPGEKRYDVGRVPAYKPGSTVPPDVATIESVKHRNRKVAQAAITSPVLKVLDQTTRPLHAVAGAADVAVKHVKAKGIGDYLVHGTHGQALHAAQRGIENKDRTTFSTVLKDAGVKNKAVRGVAGFGLDVALDPTTYLTGGTGSVAAKTAAKAGARVEAKALSKGLTKEQAARAGQRAATRAEKAAPAGKGVTVKFAGKEVPGVRKATAKAGRGGGKVTRKIVPQRVRTGARNVAADINPDIAPAGVSKATSRKAVSATRTARAKTNEGNRRAINIAAGIKSRIGEKNYNLVVDAIEAGRIGKLPADLRQPAIELRSHFKHVRRVQRRAGVKVADVTKGGQVKGYVYRQVTDAAAEAAGKATTKRGGLKPPSSKARVEKRPLAVVRAESPGKYREDLHALAAERVAHGHKSAALAGLNRSLADLGTPVRRGHAPTIGDGEAVFHIKAGNAPREVTDRAELARATAPLRLNKSGTKVKNATPKAVGAGRYVVLSRDVVKRAQEGASPTLASGKGVLSAYDKATSGFKRLALGTPGFHLRNVVGDTAQAYVHQPGQKLIPNMVRSGRTLKAAGRLEKAQRDLGHATEGKGKLRTKHYGHVSYEEAAKQLIAHGAARSGYTARELRELSQSGKQGIHVPKITSPAGVKRAFLNREDLPRLATAINAVRQGATWEEAAQKVADVHFDYGHLTSFERNIARRIFPFYTWTARNVPLQAKRIVTNPGKYAAYQKVREEATQAVQPDKVDPKTRDLYKQLQAAGVKMTGGWERYLSEYEQRNAGVPVSWKGHKFTVSMGLPLQDLNELPGAAGAGQAREYGDRVAQMVSPIVKDPVELGFNYSFFFRDQVERDNSPLVSAPAFVGSWPDAAKKKLGVVKATDKRSGKRVWMWPGKVDYVAHALPGIPNYAQQFATPGHDRRGKSLGGKVLAFAGVKSVPFDPTTNAVNLAYARQQQIQKRLKILGQQGINHTNPSPEWRKLNDQLKITTQIAYRGKAQRGDAVLPPQGGPPKIRARKGSNVTLNGAGGGSKVTLGGGGSGSAVTLGG